MNLPLPRARQMLVDAFERRYVEHVLRLHNGNVARAASAAGIARRYFQLMRARQSGR
jgi:two-component system response regulator HydG